MNHDLLSKWLGLPNGNGPPNHYGLLGLPAGESDVRRIEQQVHERMERVRQYQLSHPEEATEAMNRLAQALVCLTNAESKEAYDAGLLGKPAGAAASPKPAPEREAKPAVELRPPTRKPREDVPQRTAPGAFSKTVVDLDTAKMPPVSRAPAAEPSSSPDRPEKTPQALPSGGQDRLLDANQPTAMPEPGPLDLDSSPILVSAPVDPVFETARSSPEAKRGLGTKRALYNRIAHTRQLLRAWEQAGKYLSKAKRRLTRPAEETDLVNHLTEIRELLEDFPALLGQPGQPGQHVLAIARQQMIAPTFKMLDTNQRQALAKDWMSGRTLLTFHRQFLRQELHALRKRSRWGLTVRAVRAALNDHPGYVIIGVGCAALVVALFHWITG